MNPGQTDPQTQWQYFRGIIKELKILLEAKSLAYEGKAAEVAGLIHQKAEEKLRADQNFDSYERVKRSFSGLQTRYDETLRVLELILPLAKGYASQHRVGSNQAYIEEALICILESKERL